MTGSKNSLNDHFRSSDNEVGRIEISQAPGDGPATFRTTRDAGSFDAELLSSAAHNSFERGRDMKMMGSSKQFGRTSTVKIQVRPYMKIQRDYDQRSSRWLFSESRPGPHQDLLKRSWNPVSAQP